MKWLIGTLKIMQNINISARRFREVRQLELILEQLCESSNIKLESVKSSDKWTYIVDGEYNIGLYPYQNLPN